MNKELLNFYKNSSLGIAVYKRIDEYKFEFVYYNKAGQEMDGVVGINYNGKLIDEVFPNIKNFGLLDLLEEVYHTGATKELPLSGYTVNNHLKLYRKNRVQKLEDDLVVSVYSDESKTQEYINRIEKENHILNKALDYTSHDLRGNLSTSLGVLELFETIEVQPDEKEYLLHVMKENLEKIDNNIHRLVRMLYKAISDKEENLSA
ncbi:hypothetical protein EI427_09425 [Flammeovirga pectinis]|uniref:Uncharacterized protein n=1 Tax=Flammeovirga pectinis TaxID=2494373 RepID=A0A3Q9FQJ1_9BACT|nr:hypothetical protein [Flammeovirga pectinis]AZQ62450.1 hypothetical protein EI427_09425 [Flammeovirga pectinis]